MTINDIIILNKFSNVNFNDPNLYLTFIGIYITGVFTFKRSLLINTRPFKIILCISIFLFAISFLFEYVVDRNSENWYWTLRIPIISLLLFRLFRLMFHRLFKREPIDTTLDLRNVTPDSDKAFNIIYALLSIFIPFGLHFIGIL
jgi:hypothetical protein